jgi:hypothetical protein
MIKSIEAENEIISYPECILVYYDRYTYINRKAVVLEFDAEIPEFYNIGDYKYVFKSVIVYGGSGKSGHFRTITYIAGKLVEYNDDRLYPKLTPISLNNITKKTVLVMYQKAEKISDRSTAKLLFAPAETLIKTPDYDQINFNTLNDTLTALNKVDYTFNINRMRSNKFFTRDGINLYLQSIPHGLRIDNESTAPCMSSISRPLNTSSAEELQTQIHSTSTLSFMNSTTTPSIALHTTAQP